MKHAIITKTYKIDDQPVSREAFFEKLWLEYEGFEGEISLEIANKIMDMVDGTVCHYNGGAYKIMVEAKDAYVVFDKNLRAIVTRPALRGACDKYIDKACRQSLNAMHYYVVITLEQAEALLADPGLEINYA